MSPRSTRAVGGLVIAVALILRGSTPVETICGFEIVSAVQGNSFSSSASLSADGRYMAFSSNASTLVASDTNGAPDIFVYDRIGCTIERISVNSNEVAANGASLEPSISDDGNVVAFASLATNMIVGQTEGFDDYDIYVRNRSAGTTVRVSVSTLGVKGNSHSHFPAISGDGSVVAFHSQASNLVTSDTNNIADIFVYAGGTTTRVTVDSSGNQGVSAFTGLDLYHPALSADGRFVTFATDMTNLVAGDSNGHYDVFRHDRQTGATMRVSVQSNGSQANFSSFHPSISGDGRYIAFDSDATDLVPSDTNFFHDIFVRDVTGGTTSRISLTPQGAQSSASSDYPSISADGRYVAFLAGANDQVVGDNNPFGLDIVVRDLQAGITRLASSSANGVQANNQSQYPDISADGQFVAFESAASTLVPSDPNGTTQDVFNVHWPALPFPQPTAMDLNGDTNGDVFLYSAAFGHWAFQNAVPAGGFTGGGGAWSAGFSVTSARFNADALADMFLFNPTSGQWFVMVNNGAGSFTVQASGFWSTAWQRYVRDLDGDGISDVFLWDPNAGMWFKCLFTGSGFTYAQGFWSLGWELYPLQFDTLAAQDFFLYNRSSGQWYWAVGAGSTFTYPQTGFWSTEFQFYPGDFSGDGLSDILLFRPSNGQWFIAASGGSGFTYSSGFFSLGWTFHVLDLDANVRSDLFLHNQTTGQWFELLSSGFGTGISFAVGGNGFWSVGWQVRPVDFNGDGRADLLLYNPSNGQWFQARNLTLGTFSYSSGIWGSGLTTVTGGLGS